jgi:hypothetical protein
MANRTFSEFQYALEKGKVDLFARVSVAAAGAVTLKKWNPATRTYSAAPTSGVGSYSVGSQGIKTVARTGTGLWTVTLQDSYQRLLGAFFTCSNSTGAMTVVTMGVDTDGDVTSNTAPTVMLVFSSSASTAADPASGDEIDLHLILQNSATK